MKTEDIVRFGDLSKARRILDRIDECLELASDPVLFSTIASNGCKKELRQSLVASHKAALGVLKILDVQVDAIVNQESSRVTNNF